jgi:hypothetical protein
MATEVDQNDRTKEISDMYEIEGWTGFDFPGRKGKYSDMKWGHIHFVRLSFFLSDLRAKLMRKSRRPVSTTTIAARRLPSSRFRVRVRPGLRELTRSRETTTTSFVDSSLTSSLDFALIFSVFDFEDVCRHRPLAPRRA